MVLRLKLEYEKPLSNVAFKFNLRRYSLAVERSVAVKGAVKILDTTDGKESGGACQISLPSRRMPFNSKSSRKHALDEVAVKICLSADITRRFTGSPYRHVHRTVGEHT